MKKKSVLVVFGEELPRKWLRSQCEYDCVVAKKKLQQEVEVLGCKWIALEELVEPGSIYEASAFAEELSRLELPDGTRVSKSFIYKGYELWWIHYNNLFLYFCLPYTQYKKLLTYLKDFQSVHLYRPSYKGIFSCYLRAYRCKVSILRSSDPKPFLFFPFGVFLQIMLTLLSLPALAVRKRRIMLFTGDKFEKNRDHDFRMRFIYEELRQRNLPFVEFIRSLESWKTVLGHAFKRKRPVVYPEAVTFIGQFLSAISGGRRRAKQRFGEHISVSLIDPEERFKLSVATQYLLGVYDDIWATRIMKWILRAIGVRVALIPSASERNFHAVLGCKLNAISTVGILHGVASRHYNVYEFMPGFDGEKILSVDKFGLWSEWWRTYFREHSMAYKSEQLYVSGLMRPLLINDDQESTQKFSGDVVSALFISEESAAPQEILPYLHEFLKQKDIELAIKFRPYRDGFEEWLLEHDPSVLKRGNIRIVRGSMQDAIKDVDVVVGSYSTAVLEALVQLKVPVFFRTKKWGDYYDLKEYDKKHSFFAESPKELIKKIKDARLVPMDSLKNLRERYFGDPHRNGSRWVVEQVEKVLRHTP